MSSEAHTLSDLEDLARRDLVPQRSEKVYKRHAKLFKDWLAARDGDLRSVNGHLVIILDIPPSISCRDIFWAVQKPERTFVTASHRKDVPFLEGAGLSTAHTNSKCKLCLLTFP